MTLYDLFVPGDPKGQPRPRAFARKGFGARVYDPGTAEHWKGEIAVCFPRQGAGLVGPLSVWLRFLFKRPQAHARKDGTLKPTSPAWHTAKPDSDNAAKAVLDCLTTIGVWRDDAQVAELHVTKKYADPGCSTGCQITILSLEQ